MNGASPQSSKATARRTSRLAAVATLVAGALLLTSCPTGVDWSDYDGVNLIGGQDFGDTDSTTGAPWFLTPGLTATTAEVRDDDVTGVDYVRWERTSGTEAYAPPAEANQHPVYRMEVVNLFQNGDFESGTATSGWVESGNGTAGASTVTGTSALAGEQSLRLDFELPDTRYYTDLTSTTTGLADGFVVDRPYAFHIDFRLDVEVFGLEQNNDVTASVLQTWSISRPTGDTTITYAYPGRDRENPVQSADPNLITRASDATDLTLWSFGGLDTVSRQRVEGRFDNIRFVRSDQAHYLRLPVPYNDTGRPVINSGGVYTFSVWAKADPAAIDSADTDFGNKFPARHLSVGLDTTPDERINHQKIVDSRRISLENVNDEPDRWHQLTWELSGAGVLPPFTADDDFVVFDIILEVGQAIAGPPYQDAGSILLTAPSLTWQPQ